MACSAAASFASPRRGKSSRVPHISHQARGRLLSALRLPPPIGWRRFNSVTHLERSRRSGEIPGRAAVVRDPNGARDLHGPFFRCNNHHFAVDWQGQPTDQRQLALLYGDLRDALRYGPAFMEADRLFSVVMGVDRDNAGISVEEDDSVISTPR